MNKPWISTWQLPNHFERPLDVEVSGALVHSMAEWILADSTSIERYYSVVWLQKLKLSVHAFITPTGTIIRSVPDSRGALHAGVSKFQDLSGLNKSFLGAEFLVPGMHNYSTFLEAIKTDCFTDNQYKSGGYLYAYWSTQFPRVNKDTIVAHSFVSGDDVRGRGKGKKDPGPGFKWDLFWHWYDYYLARRDLLIS